MGETEPTQDMDPEWSVRQVRYTALHAAMQINAGKGDYQEVIRAARDILAFLKEG